MPPPTRYKFHIALIVVVDKENHSQIAMQALLSDKRSEFFESAFESFKQLCKGGTPGVVFTDYDAAAMLAIAKVYPSALNNLCIWHTMGNIREHGGGLENGVLGQILGLFKAAAYAQTEEGKHRLEWQPMLSGPRSRDVLLLLLRRCLSPVSPVCRSRQLVTSSVSCPPSLSRPVTRDRRAGRWASYVHPGLHTLGIASTQRVESMNAAVKKLVTRKGDNVHLGRALLGKVQDDINRSQRRNLGGTVARVAVQGHSYVEDFRTKHLRTFNFVLNAVNYEQCSQHATEVSCGGLSLWPWTDPDLFSPITPNRAPLRCGMPCWRDTEAQILGALHYEAKPVVRGEEAARRLFEELVADPTKANLTYDTGSGELVDPSIPTSDAAGFSMVSRTSVPHFAELLRDQNVTRWCASRRSPRRPGAVTSSPLDRTASSSASACGSLSTGYFARTPSRPCACQASIGAAGLTGPAGPPGQMLPVDPNPIVSSQSGTNLSAYAYANGVTLGKELGGMFKEVSVASIQRLVESMKHCTKQQIEVEKRSLRDESTSRVFTGTPPAHPCPAAGRRRGERVALEAAAREVVAVETPAGEAVAGAEGQATGAQGGAETLLVSLRVRRAVPRGFAEHPTLRQDRAPPAPRLSASRRHP
ncbi:unnamed protein product [Ectocarpus sp. CCAP 1310/34]|nr:unnamed protein product [Ectocarpus sp. CCAP 1310/34]